MNELFRNLSVLLIFFIALIAFVILARGILARRQSQKMIGEISEQLRLQIAALNAAANAIVISDCNGNCIWVNPAFTVLTGYEPGEILGQKLSKLKSGVQEDKFYKDLWETILGGSVWHGEIVNKNKQGVLYVEEMTISPVPNDKGEITHFIAIKLDITERKRMQVSLEDMNKRLVFQMGEIEVLQERLREQALRDPLTNLYNRRFLEETLNREIAHARRDRGNLCVAMIDVDGFKPFNDRYGHKTGDMILRSLGDILLANTRKGDVACRYGGDEFVVVMPGADVDNALKRAKHWRNAFQLLQQSFNSQELQSTISIGVAVFPDHGMDGDAVIHAADKAMYESKARGKNCVTIFDASLFEQK